MAKQTKKKNRHYCLGLFAVWRCLSATNLLHLDENKISIDESRSNVSPLFEQWIRAFSAGQNNELKMQKFEKEPIRS